MAKVKKAVVGKFIVGNKKAFTDKTRLLNESQTWVDSEQVFAGDVLEMEVESQDALELVTRELVIPLDDAAKKAYKNFENDKLVEKFQAIAKERSSKGK